MDTVKDARIRQLEGEVEATFKRYGNDLPPAVAAEVRGKIDELNALVDATKASGELRKRWGEMNSYLNDPVGRPRQPGDGGGRFGASGGKSIGEAFVESKAFRDYDPAQRKGPSADIGLKTLLDTTGWEPESPRIPRIEPGVGRPLNVIDLFGYGNTSYNSVPFMRETTTTNAAAETAEGSDKPQSTLAFTEVDSPVRTIATTLPITNQLLEDVAACRDYINQRLAYFVRERLDSQVLVGDGSAPNLRGILNVVGVQSQAKGADPTPDAIGKAMDLCRVNGGYQPDGIVMHPSDWQDIRHLRTANGEYIWGSPADANPPRIWGLPVAVSTAITQNTALVGAFKTAAMLFYRTDLQIAISDSHSDFFIKNQVMIRAEIRVALACFRPEAFCMVTGV